MDDVRQRDPKRRDSGVLGLRVDRRIELGTVNAFGSFARRRT